MSFTCNTPFIYLRPAKFILNEFWDHVHCSQGCFRHWKSKKPLWFVWEIKKVAPSYGNNCIFSSFALPVVKKNQALVGNLFDSDKDVARCSSKKTAVLEHVVHQIGRVVAVAATVDEHESRAEKLFVENFVIWNPDIHPVLPHCSLRMIRAIIVDVVNLMLGVRVFGNKNNLSR